MGTRQRLMALIPIATGWSSVLISRGRFSRVFVETGTIFSVRYRGHQCHQGSAFTLRTSGTSLILSRRFSEERNRYRTPSSFYKNGSEYRIPIKGNRALRTFRLDPSNSKVRWKAFQKETSVFEI